MMDPMAGYSGVPLAKKLGITEDSSVILLHAPTDVVDAVPPGVRIRTLARGSADVVVACFTRRADLERRIDALGRVVFPGGGIWIGWPKQSSGVDTDMSDDAVRAVVLPKGLVDNKVAAIDDTWSGLRVVWRRELRGAGAPPAFWPGPSQRRS
jgi:hypothetical protein